MAFNKFSNKFITKFLGNTFKVTPGNWISVFYLYMIDTKYRRTQNLDAFLMEQLYNPHKTLIKIAKEIRAESKSPDELIINVLRYVNERTNYITDTLRWGYIEKWSKAYDTWRFRRGDCEDQNSLIYILARLAGISDLVLWSAIGDSKVGGHYWLIYFSIKTQRWYPIDSTLDVDLRGMNSLRNPRRTFNFNKDRYYNIWYLFNEQIILKQK